MIADTVGDAIAADVDAQGDTAAAMTVAIERLKATRADYAWVGIYLLDGDALVLGPYLGKPSPHTRIPLNRGICGAAATSGATIIVDDVRTDPRFLACSLETRSEIVVPIMAGGRVLGEIDIDSDRVGAFGEPDQRLLERVADALGRRLAADTAAS